MFIMFTYIAMHALVGPMDASFVYDQSAMRKHFKQCNNAVIRDQQSGNARIDTIDVYCSCRSPDDGSSMVQCDKGGI